MKSLSDLGFDGIELGVFDPAVDGSPDEMSRIKQLLESNELEAPNLYIDMAGHWPLASFTYPDPDVRRDVVKLLKAGIEIAKGYGISMMVVRWVPSPNRKNRVCLSKNAHTGVATFQKPTIFRFAAPTCIYVFTEIFS